MDDLDRDLDHFFHDLLTHCFFAFVVHNFSSLTFRIHLHILVMGLVGEL